MTIYAAIIAGILIGFALVEIAMSLYDLFTDEEEDEMTWLLLDGDTRF